MHSNFKLCIHLMDMLVTSLAGNSVFTMESFLVLYTLVSCRKGFHTGWPGPEFAIKG